MKLEDLTPSAQNYLKALWTLSEWSGGQVTPSALAAYLELRPSSVSDQIRRLTTQKLVDHAPYGSVTLTAEGKTLALRMVRRHRLAETFLQQLLGYSWDEVHEDADLMEHAMSERMLERIDRALGFPERDPHGDPIPRADGSLPDPINRGLNESRPGEVVEAARISDRHAEVLRHVETLGIIPGARFIVVDDGIASGVMMLQQEGKEHPVPLARKLASSIRVRRLESDQ